MFYLGLLPPPVLYEIPAYLETIEDSHGDVPRSVATVPRARVDASLLFQEYSHSCHASVNVYVAFITNPFTLSSLPDRRSIVALQQ